jgi:hypothetical protein
MFQHQLQGRQHIFALNIIVMVVFLLCNSANTQAGTAEAYQQSINMAAQGHQKQAMAALSTLIKALPPQPATWPQRIQAAQELIGMQMSQINTINSFNTANPYLNLAASYMRNNPPRTEAKLWPATVLATLLPGAGHAWQGRWHDAYTAALMVWPMLFLTLWALKRRMGPVTVFFALITIWLWSGTVFSSISLAERGSLESYMIWWQQVWLASGLPGRPW